MSQPDPDDTPTRHGDEQPTRRVPAAEDRTLPAGRVSRPEDRTQAAPADQTLPALDKQDKKPAPPRPQPAGGKPAPAPTPVVKSTEPQDPLLDKLLGGCRLTKLLGRGAMGAVYKARQEKLDRDVAVKVIRPEMMTDKRMLKRFEVEARTVAKFNSAHVVMVHDVGFELGMHYLVMEFVEGKNLRDHVKLLAGGRLPVGEALPMLRQAIRGLEEAQRLEVVHRDIKPDNLMITDRAVLKIADFGIAKPLQEDFSMTLTSELVGTPLYMSPEQCQGHAAIDFRSDMYSLGATFFYLLTGEPPIRASSVYELIATKTKMAHLCLWKALPGLDENNPLSRVIERMTALDRDDRYPSYEALLNDLVLVEAGQTIAPTTKSKSAVPIGDEAATRVTTRQRAAEPVEPRPKRTGLIVAAVMLLAAIGGGYAWFDWPAPVDTGKRVTSELRALRARLGNDGPSPLLLEDLGKVAAVTQEHRDERARLIDDVEVGLAVKAALATIQKPARLELPFKDLASYLAAVDTAAQPGKPVGSEVVAFCNRQREVARAESELGSLGLATLTKAFADWQERVRLNADEGKVAELETQIDGVIAAREALYQQLLGLRARLDEELAADRLVKARADLRAGTMPGGADVSEALTRLRAAFAKEGPIPSLLADADKLRPADAQQREDVAALVNAMGTAKTAADNAAAIATSFPGKPVPPFDTVEQYLASITLAFAPVRNGDGQYPEWAATMLRTLRNEETLQKLVVAACITLWQDWQLVGSKAPAAATSLAAVRTAKARAIALFEAAKSELDAAIPDAAMADANTEVNRTGMRRQWLAEAESLASRLGLVTTLGAWVAGGPGIETALAGLRTGAAAIGSDEEVAGMLARLVERIGRWSAAVAALAETDRQFGAGQVTGALKLSRTGAAGNEGRAEFTTASEVAGAVAAAFDAFARTLDLAAMEQALREADTKLRGVTALTASATRITGWLEAMARLRAATSGMVPIPGGKPRGAAAPIEPFFLDATECSREQFAQFQAELAKATAGGADAPAKFDLVQQRLQGIGLTPERLREILSFSPGTPANDLPVERVTWFAAAAYAAWHDRALPTTEQWALAAFGDGGGRKFPWGDEWTRTDNNLRNVATQPVDVDKGGLSWRRDGGQLHHLAGNVAEWLAAPPEANSAQVVGGRYEDGDASAQEQASGKVMPVANKTDGRKGYGFRTVLAVRTFPGLDWPQ